MSSGIAIAIPSAALRAIAATTAEARVLMQFPLAPIKASAALLYPTLRGARD
ncbi:hypothetical protein [Gloeocapsopsis dulcis]|uniref:hypothetical protein n=1 Tax=Gloeocapsopsis dulcis TaxID=2859516 RepID=UPI0012DAAD68|nr:hypothetical protein [Gloeocapsopsis dulcis]WNN91831.1 hypothetical protein P0S91_12505 [Gloeocapsopsis dulcis]